MNPHILASLVICLSLCLPHGARADIITLTSGRVIEGTVIQRDAGNLVILADYGTTSVPTNIVRTIVAQSDKRPTTLSTNTATVSGRLPDWSTIVSRLAEKAWADKLRQIPATVITNGVLKNVPYISFRCGIDYEVNIYGDLDNPAGIEVGFYRSLLAPDKKEYAAGTATRFVASVLNQPGDREAVARLGIQKETATRDGLTFEVSPESDADAYGGWWVSVYDTKALDQARATDKQLEEIAVLNSAIIKADEPAVEGVTWTKDDLRYARPAATASVAPAAAPSVNQPATSPTTYRAVSLPPARSSGRVFVRAYTKSDGTYVREHTRSAPRR